jgi:hypothetical protein
MTRSMSARELVTEVELAVLAGRNLDQIEAEILGSSGLDEEARSAFGSTRGGYGERLSRPQPSLPAG